MPNDWVESVQTIEEAREFVLKVGVCGVLHDKSGAPNLYDAVDAPEKQPGDSGWGDKMGKVWSWKNELPARYPDEIFYGKRKGGGAILCSMAHLKQLYADQHKPLEALSETARKLYEYIEQNPLNNSELKQLSGMSGKASKSAYDRALLELQVAFQIVRVNQTDVEGDTWTPFALQYPDFVP
jgi:hypothetical protein